MTQQLIVTWPDEEQTFELPGDAKVQTIDGDVYVASGVSTVAKFNDVRSWRIVSCKEPTS